jgi:hypothetical protein
LRRHFGHKMMRYTGEAAEEMVITATGRGRRSREVIVKLEW